MSVLERWSIRGTLTTLTPLHIGTGEPVEDRVRADAEGREIQVNAIELDHRGKPFVPGSALKGVVRQRAQVARGPIAPGFVDEVLGSEDLGGRGEFANAFLSSPVAAFKKPPPHWDPRRCTGVMPHVAIDAATRAAAAKLLFFDEFVPPGCSFVVEINGPLLAEEVATMLALLGGFGDSFDAIRLGADGLNGWGRMRWKLNDLRSASPETIQRRPGGGWPGHDCGYDLAISISDRRRQEIEKLAGSVDPGIARTRMVLDIDLQFEEGFLVQAPAEGGAEKAGVVGGPDRVPLCDVDGKPYLPAASFRGSFRSQGERILATVRATGQAGAAAEPPEAEGGKAEPRPVPGGGSPALDLESCLFGSTGWASALEVEDFRLKAAAVLLPQEFIAIDRFTGGGARIFRAGDGASRVHGLKFNAESAYRPRLQGRIAVDLERLRRSGATREAMGLLVLMLRDLAEGDIRFGYGRSKGFGECRAAIRIAQLPTESPEALEILGLSPEELQQAGPGALEPKSPIHAKLAAAIEALRAREGGSREVRPAEPRDFAASLEGPSSGAGESEYAETGHRDAFYNPYHFVPVVPESGDRQVSVAAFDSREPEHLFHRSYAAGSYSGRLLCKLSTRTPVFVGGERKPAEGNRPAKVEPFRLPGAIDALPGSSLRGLVSSIAEAASNSALRVLSNTTLSYRRAFRDPHILSALGLVVAGDGAGRLALRPLTLPTLAVSGDRAALPEDYRGLFPSPCLKAYFGTPSSICNARTFKVRTSTSGSDFYWAKLRHGDRKWESGSTTLGRDPGWRVKRFGRSEFLVAQELADSGLLKEHRKGYKRGLVRVLGVWDRPVPRGKKHEIFIPYPDEAENWPTITIPEDVRRRFHDLADERTRASDEDHPLPYELRDTLRNPLGDPDDRRLRLKPGDIVFFRPETRDGQRVVAEVAVSSIWRGRVETQEIEGPYSAATPWEFFESIDAELVPFHDLRQQLTHAEELFGFAALRTKVDAPSRALASRVSFTSALPPLGATVRRLPETTLKTLAEPKPPSPALYFRPRGGSGHIAKRDLDVGKHDPQGRKFYLHQKGDEDGEPWASTSDATPNSTKSRIEPLEAKQDFYFAVDFDNLTERDMGLLCYALRPTANFRHKIGMGKPIGLGTVAISWEAACLVDRSHRYTPEGFQSPRYAAVSSPAGGDPRSWPERFRIEAEDTGETPESSFDPSRFAAAYRTGMPSSIRRALEHIGETILPADQVNYPLATRQSDPERETYKWFAHNDHHKQGDRQALEPLDRAEGLKGLRRNE